MPRFADGDYVNLIPAEADIRLLDADTGTPLSHATVDLFLDWGVAYQDVYHPDPDRTFQTDESGVFHLPAP